MMINFRGKIATSMANIKQRKVVLISVFCFFILAISLVFFIQCFSQPFIGIVLSNSNHSWSVATIDNNGLADEAGIKVGDKPIEVNGIPAETFLNTYGKVGIVYENIISEVTVVDSQGQTKSVALHSSSPSLRSSTDVAVLFFVSLIFWIVGFYVYFKRPDNRAALLLCLCSLIIGLAFCTTLAASRLIPAALEMAIIASVIAPWLLVHFFLALPEERVWARSSPLVYCIYIPAVITLILFPLIGYSDGQALPAFRTFRFMEYVGGFLAVAGVAGFNYFGASSQRTRQQMKIVSISCVMALIPFLLLYIFPVAIFKQNIIPSVFNVLFVAFIPLGMGYAVVTQRLLDIDVIIRRSVIYGLITIVMAGILSIAILPILAIQKSLSASERILLVLVLGGVATALFGPIKKGIEILVDKLFYKDRFDYRQTIQTLSNSLNSMKDLSEVSRLIVGTTVNTLNLAGGCLMIRDQNIPFRVTAAEGVYADVDRQNQLSLYIFKRNPRIEFPNSALSVGSDLAFMIPLIAGDKEVGFLFLTQKTTRQDFSRDDIYLLQGLASVGAAALRSASLIHDVSLRDTFVSIASHELRTPLTSIIGYAELLSRHEYSEEVRKTRLKNILDNGQKIADIVDDLLNVERIQSGRINLKIEAIQLPSVIEDRLAIIKESSSRHQFIVETEPRLPAALVDRDKFGQIMSNLLTNAVKYSPKGGRVTISACGDPPNKRVIVSVADEGIGISPEDKNSLFKTFHRIQRPETKVIRGIGLGLYIVKEWVEAMNGDVWLESELDKGSTFYVAFPMTANEPPVRKADDSQVNQAQSKVQIQ